MTSPEYETIIIGSGFAGLAIARELKMAGKDNFLIVEKAGEVGGTWRENIYPGAKCDTQSIFYSFSFAPNPDWEFKWSRQPQILQYIKDLYLKFDVRRHVQFNTSVSGAQYNHDEGIWCVNTDQGSFTSRYIVSAVGQLHHPRLPNIPGMEDFEGPSYHSAQWDSSVDLAGKNVAVVGAAASSVQLFPELAKIAKNVTVYQRSANWVMELGDAQYSNFSKWLARYLPFIRRLRRAFNVFQAEYILYPAIKGSSRWRGLLESRCLGDMKKHITDPELQKSLTPTYAFGSKRVLFSDSFYPALARENVDLVTSAIDKVTPTGIQLCDGQANDHDVIVYATGFKTNPFLNGLDIQGRDGKRLADHWENGAYAYLTVTTSGFPNMFFMYGPNSNTGHHSILFKLETQAGFIAQLIANEGKHSIEAKADVEQRFSDEIQERLQRMAWATVDASWYKHGDKVTNNWPGNGKEYSRRLKTPNWSEFEIRS